MSQTDTQKEREMDWMYRQCENSIHVPLYPTTKLAGDINNHKEGFSDLIWGKYEGNGA